MVLTLLNHILNYGFYIQCWLKANLNYSQSGLPEVRQRLLVLTSFVIANLYYLKWLK